MANVNKVFLKKIVTAIVIVLTFAGCDPSYYYELNVKNTTSQTITIQVILESLDSLDSCNYSNSLKSCYFNGICDSITLKAGEKHLFAQNSGLGTISSDDITWIMENVYPFGIIIKFENGDSLVYYPSGADKDFHSPYNKHSFLSVDKTDYELVSEYDVLY